MDLLDLRLASGVGEGVGTRSANTDIVPLITANLVIATTSQNAVVSLATPDYVSE
ncbi:MAG: hypothetical protein Q8K73_02900 [Anaerolineales bacterium]|nr:hypothetical protein [Anaerolineales bacterium]